MMQVAARKKCIPPPPPPPSPSYGLPMVNRRPGNLSDMALPNYGFGNNFNDSVNNNMPTQINKENCPGNWNMLQFSNPSSTYLQQPPALLNHPPPAPHYTNIVPSNQIHYNSTINRINPNSRNVNNSLANPYERMNGSLINNPKLGYEIRGINSSNDGVRLRTKSDRNRNFPYDCEPVSQIPIDRGQQDPCYGERKNLKNVESDKNYSNSKHWSGVENIDKGKHISLRDNPSNVQRRYSDETLRDSSNPLKSHNGNSKWENFRCLSKGAENRIKNIKIKRNSGNCSPKREDEYFYKINRSSNVYSIRYSSRSVDRDLNNIQIGLCERQDRGRHSTRNNTRSRQLSNSRDRYPTPPWRRSRKSRRDSIGSKVIISEKKYCRDINSRVYPKTNSGNNCILKEYTESDERNYMNNIDASEFPDQINENYSNKIRHREYSNIIRERDFNDKIQDIKLRQKSGNFGCWNKLCYDDDIRTAGSLSSSNSQEKIQRDVISNRINNRSSGYSRNCESNSKYPNRIRKIYLTDN